MAMYNCISIGIDQSYNCTGISICGDGQLLKITSIKLDKYKNNSEKRKHLKKYLENMIEKVYPKAGKLVCVIERIRLQSKGFLNINYIKSIGALNSVIVDVLSEYNVDVYSVDTRCWKAQVIGTSKPKSNKYGVPNEKWPTVKWVINQGLRKAILEEVKNPRKTKGTFIKNGKKYQYNNDAADSAGIALFWFVGERDKLKLEK